MNVDRDRIELEGIVSSALGYGRFRVQTETHEVLCTLSGKMRENSIKIVEGDRVKIEVSPYDMKMGRIIYRGRA